jgi:hypothetical protein
MNLLEIFAFSGLLGILIIIGVYFLLMYIEVLFSKAPIWAKFVITWIFFSSLSSVVLLISYL